jgi:hypothetical protein
MAKRRRVNGSLKLSGVDKVIAPIVNPIHYNTA